MVIICKVMMINDEDVAELNSQNFQARTSIGNTQRPEPMQNTLPSGCSLVRRELRVCKCAVRFLFLHIISWWTTWTGGPVLPVPPVLPNPVQVLPVYMSYGKDTPRHAEKRWEVVGGSIDRRGPAMSKKGLKGTRESGELGT